MKIRHAVSLFTLLLASCAGGDAPNLETSPPDGAGTSDPTPTVMDGSPGTQATEAMPWPEQPGEIQPGTYRTAVFQPTLQVTVGDGWAADSPDLPYFLAMVPNGDLDEFLFPLVSFVRLAGVETFLEWEAGSPQEVDPGDPYEFLRNRPHLQVDDPAQAEGTITISGQDVAWFQATVAPPQGSPTREGPDGPNAMYEIARIDGQPLFFPEGEVVWITVVPEPEPVLVTIEGHPEEFDRIFELATELLETVTFDPE